MPEGHNSIHCIKNNRVVNHAIVVQLAKILDLRNSALVKFEVILLQTKHDIFKSIVNNGRDKVLMVPIQRTCEDCKEVYIAVLDFSGL